jgi:two-component system, NtrC family, sensor histidine kinase HydH
MGVSACDLPLQLAWDEALALVGVEGAFPDGSRPRTGMPLAEALRVDARAARALDQRARDGGGVEFVRSGAAGERRWLRLSLDAAGTVARARVLDLDALLDGAPPLQISALSSSLSHELRNPLSSVKMAVQTLARNEGHSPRDQRRLTIAQREIRTLERMLWLLSEYGREDPLSVEGWALGDLVRQSLEFIEPELSERRIAPRLESSPDLPRVRADPVRLRPVLGQLLLNVAASIPEGNPLQARLAPSARGAQLRLVDAAAFLAPGEEERIFEPFGSRLARGAGLSLAALRRVMQQQDGDVTADPAPGHGIAFTLDFARVD